MWRRCIIVGVICICFSWWWCWYHCKCETPACDCPDHVEVFVTAACNVENGSGSPMSDVYVDPNDVVIWNNQHADTVWVTFDGANGTPFIQTEFVLPSGTQWVAKVRSDAGGKNYTFKLKCGAGGVIGGPEVKVGGGGS